MNEMENKAKKYNSFINVNFDELSEEQIKDYQKDVAAEIQHTEDQIKVQEEDYEFTKKINDIKFAKENFRKVRPEWKYEELDEYWDLKYEQVQKQLRDKEMMSKNIIQGNRDYIKGMELCLEMSEKALTKKKRNG